MEKPRRRWFTFSLRTFFVLLTVFGVWLGVQLKWIRDRHEAADRFGFYLLDEAAAPWSLRIFAERGYEAIGVLVDDPDHPTADEQRIKRELEQLFPEADVFFGAQGHGWSGGGFNQ